MKQLFVLSLLLALVTVRAEVLPPRPATQTEVNAGVNRVNPVTPYTLANKPGGGVSGGTGTTNQTWFNVKDYGAVPDDNTDDTAAIQAAINAALPTNSYSQSTIFFPKGKYIISGALGVTNSQLYLPQINSGSNTTNWSYLRFLGESPQQYQVGTQIGTGLFYTNNASVLYVVNSSGGSTLASKSDGGDATFPFNRVTVGFENMTFVVAANNNGVVLNLTNVESAFLLNVAAHPPQLSDNSTAPAHGSVFADFPNSNCGSGSFINGVCWQHFDDGIRVSEHVTADNLYGMSCSNALALKDGNFPIYISHIYTGANVVGIKGTGTSIIYIADWAIERSNTGDWRNTGAVDFSGGNTTTAGQINFDVYDNINSSKHHKLSHAGGELVQWYNIFNHQWINFSENTSSALGAFAARSTVHTYVDDSARVGGVYAGKAEGTTYAPTAPSIGNGTGTYFIGGWDGGQWITHARITGLAEGAVSSGVMPGGIQIYTGTNDSTQTCQFWLDKDGNLSIGGTFFPTNGLNVPKTITAAGTTGARTINKTSGCVNFAASATTLVVTDSLVASTSVIICTVGTVDTTAKSAVAVAGSGSFTITLNAAATAETRVNFLVTN